MAQSGGQVEFAEAHLVAQQLCHRREVVALDEQASLASSAAASAMSPDDRLTGRPTRPATDQFLGSSAGLSSSVVTKLTEQWKADQRAFCERDLSEVDFVYLWADGIHVNIRLEAAKLCLLVTIGVRADGYRESTESWADLLRDCKRRGMRAPVLAVGDGARSGSGARCARCFPKPASSAAGSTGTVKDL